MIVYVITKGCYSDYHICSVTTDKRKAKRLAAIYSDSWGKANVETFDTEADEPLLRGESKFTVTFRKGAFSNIYTEVPDYATLGVMDFNDGRMDICLYAKDEEHAKKIACDMRAKYLAEKADL